MSSRLKKITPASKLARKTKTAEAVKPKTAGKPGKRVMPKIEAPTAKARSRSQSRSRSEKSKTDSYLEVSDVDDVSEFGGSFADLSEFEAHLSSLTGGSGSSDDNAGAAGSQESAEDGTDTKSAKAKGAKAKGAKAKGAKAKGAKKSSVASTIPTPKEIIKLNTRGMVYIPKEEYPTLKPGTFIKYINQHGYLTQGGYIHSVSVYDDGEHKVERTWIIGISRQGSGIRPVTYPARWSTIRKVYIELDSEREEIKRALDDKQHYINDISTFLHQKYGDEFANFMEDRERIRQEKLKYEEQLAQEARKRHKKEIRAAKSRASSSEESSSESGSERRRTRTRKDK